MLRNPSITTAIPGVTSYDQLEQDFTVATSLDYAADVKAFLDDKAPAAQAQCCQQRGRCLGDCPRGVDIPTLMRVHVYDVQYANPAMARATLASVDSGRGLAACQACGSCRAACRDDVNMGAKIGQLVTAGPDAAA